MIDAVIWDLDGTLADVRHRLHLIRQTPPDWRGFFDATRHDLPHPEALRLNRILSRTLVPVIVTGRPEDNRQITVDWLHRHEVCWHLMLMRPDGEERPDYVVKVEQALSLRERFGLNPVMAFEDRPRVVEAMRDAGIYTLAADGAEWDKSAALGCIGFDGETR